MGSARTYDLILFGATGFTGRLVAEYLLGTGTGIKWALGGRSAAKLEEVKRALAAEHPAAAALPVVVADSLDEAAMARAAADCKVVCTTVGPYDRYGEPLVAACARAGTHYCDLTGEPQFVRRMIDRYEAAAKESAKLAPAVDEQLPAEGQREG